jgi:hypothetical protein
MSRVYLALRSGVCGGLEAVRDAPPDRETVIA